MRHKAGLRDRTRAAACLPAAKQRRGLAITTNADVLTPDRRDIVNL